MSPQMSPNVADFSPIGEKSIASKTMTEAEARECCVQIKAHMEKARALIHDLHERRGWRALGYKSWRDCVTTEFNQSKSHLYRQLDAARIEHEVSPSGEIGVIPEGQLRPLASVPEGSRKVVWDAAVESAPDGKVTAKHVAKVAAEVSPPRPKAQSNPKVIPKPVSPALADAALDAYAIAEREAIRNVDAPDIAALRAAGIMPENAEVEDTFVGGDPWEETPESPEDNELSIEDRLLLCPARTQLTPDRRKRFDADATYFWQLTPFRLEFERQHAILAKQAKKASAGTIGVYLGKMVWTLRLDDPRHWIACPHCKGTGWVELIGQCPKCDNKGYLVHAKSGARK